MPSTSSRRLPISIALYDSDMQKFIVPQFIDVESKILGPITVRQFVTVAVGGVVIFVTYRLADFSLFLLLFLVEALIIAVVGFFRFNGHPFHIFLLNVLSTYRKPSLRVWMKEEPRAESNRKKKKGEQKERVFIPKKTISSAKLSELALIIDTGGIYKGEAEANRINRMLYEE